MPRTTYASEKAIIIDTEQCSGDFERELVAYITGQVGECGVGAEEARVACVELPEEVARWFDDNVVHVADENGCRRPAAISPTPGWYNNGYGDHVRDADVYDGKLYLGRRWPCYNSVEFQVVEWPPEDVTNIIVARTKRFFNEVYRRGNVVMTRIRWVRRDVVETPVNSFNVT